MINVGDRVGAVLSAGAGAVKLLGYGVYAGHFKLDDGRVVWGCQCWWGPEDKVRQMIGDRRVVVVDLDGDEVVSSQYPPATEQPEEEV